MSWSSTRRWSKSRESTFPRLACRSPHRPDVEAVQSADSRFFTPRKKSRESEKFPPNPSRHEKPLCLEKQLQINHIKKLGYKFEDGSGGCGSWSIKHLHNPSCLWRPVNGYKDAWCGLDTRYDCDRGKAEGRSLEDEWNLIKLRRIDDVRNGWEMVRLFAGD